VCFLNAPGIECSPDLLKRLYLECEGCAQRVQEKLVENERIQIQYSTLTRLLRDLGLRCVPDEPGAEMPRQAILDMQQAQPRGPKSVVAAREWLAEITYGWRPTTLFQTEPKDRRELATLLDFVRNGILRDRKKAATIPTRARQPCDSLWGCSMPSFDCAMKTCSEAPTHQGTPCLRFRRSLHCFPVFGLYEEGWAVRVTAVPQVLSQLIAHSNSQSPAWISIAHTEVPMNQRFKRLGALLLFSAGIIAPAKAGVIFSNLGAGDSFTLTSGWVVGNRTTPFGSVTLEVAAAFTPASDAIFTGVDFAAEVLGPPGDLTVALLVTGPSGTPDAALRHSRGGTGTPFASEYRIFVESGIKGGDGILAGYLVRFHCCLVARQRPRHGWSACSEPEWPGFRAVD